jgi:hypothetical protein
MFSIIKNIKDIRDDVREILIIFRFISQILATSSIEGSNIQGGSMQGLTSLNEPNNGPENNQPKKMSDFYLANNVDKIVEEEKQEVKLNYTIKEPDFFNYNPDKEPRKVDDFFDFDEASQAELEANKQL